MLVISGYIELCAGPNLCYALRGGNQVAILINIKEIVVGYCCNLNSGGG